MQLLLDIYFKWSSEYVRTDNSAYKKALKNLKKDIYYLYSWLSGVGMTFDEVIERWSDEHSGECIKSVLDYETFKLTESFTRFASSYSRSIPSPKTRSIADLYPIPEVYSQLKVLDSFKPWNRSFYDLHQSINRKGKVNLSQPRILDNLLIITIRTEIVVREVCSSCTDSREPDDLKKVFLALSNIDSGEPRSKVLQAVANDFDKTLLKGRPDDLFESICRSPIGKNWSIEQKYFYEKLLMFITARNYFAHHSYKDTELDDHTNTVCRDVLLACLHSLLYLSSYLSKAVD
ncbi:hypothetical protein FCV87_10245 [Vibrio breoganii]|nr:hypothetical protein [Vibrio breoganii]TKG27811.1 hypothetical protein FCV87_10245 [Vibrio breoganii]